MPAPVGPLEALQRVNENLRSILVDLRPERKLCSTVRPQVLSAILSEVLRAAECLRRPLAHPESAALLEKESLEYLGNLEKLKQLLPALHLRLLAEKTRLEAAKTQAAAVADWARARKKTL